MKELFAYLISFALLLNISFTAQAQTFRSMQANSGIKPSNIKPDGSTNTQVIEAANGITIVNIAAPTINGTSMNNFDSFNVSESGAIINNSLYITETQLAGLIMQNDNLVNAGNQTATTIVAEVTSLKPTNLLGYLEIAGVNASFVLLNPNGITCSSCGFINIANLSLGTASGNYQNGNLTGMTLGSGHINIEGNGADATLTQKFTLISNYILANAAIFGGDELELQSGTGTFDLNSASFTNSTEEILGQFGIDAGEMGAMYAGKITIKASTNGLGVNIPADVIASSGSITISAEGDIIYNNLSALEEIKISGNSISGSGSVTSSSFNLEGNVWSNTGNISATNLQINTDLLENLGIINGSTSTINSNIILNEGSFFGSDILINAGSLQNEGQIISSSILQINATETLQNNGSIIADKNLDINTGSLINNGKLTSNEKLEIFAQTITNNNLIASGGSADLTGVNGITNNSEIIVGTNLALISDGKIINNKGSSILSLGNIEIKGLTQKKAESFENLTASIRAYGDISIFANQISNLGTDTFGTESGYIVTTQYYPIPGGYYSWRLIWQQIATSTITTQNSLISAGGNLNIEGDVLNHGGDILVGKDINIAGNLTNKVTSVQTTPLTSMYQEKYKNCDTLGTNCWTNTNEYYTSYIATVYSGTASSIKAGGKISVTGNLVNGGGNTTMLQNTNIGAGGGDIQSLVNSIITSSLYEIQTSIDYTNSIIGITGTEITFGYLTETGVDFTNWNNFITSAYFLTAINFFPSENIVLFDPVAEREIIMSQLLGLGAVQFLDNGSGAIDQMYIDGVDWFNANQSSLNLTFGVELTPQQVASLTHDVILPAFQIIDGVEVLVPVVYLSQNTLNGINTDTSGANIFAGGDLLVQGGEHILNAGNITTGGSMVLETGDFVNLGGSLTAGENLSITANNILIGALTESGTGAGNTTYNNITQLSSIAAGGGITLAAAENIMILGTTITAETLNLTSGENILIGAAISNYNMGNGGSFTSFTQEAYGSNLIIEGDVNINSQGSFILTSGESITQSHIEHTTTNSNFLNGNETTITDTFTLTNISSNITSGGNININSNNDLSIIGSNITTTNTTGDINLTSTTGDVNIVSVVDINSHTTSVTNVNTFDASIDVEGINSQTIVSSNLTSGGNININSGNNINILASNLTGNNGSLTAIGDINIMSAMQISQTLEYHMQTSLDLTAVAIQVGVAVAVGALTAGAGSALVATSFASMAASGASTAAIAIGVGHGVSVATEGNNAFSGFQGGDADTIITTTTQNINSNLIFTGNLELEAGGNQNTEQATITSQNINQEGLDTTAITTTEYIHETINPDYGNIIQGAVITGVVAGLIVTGEALLTDYVGSKPTGETAQVDYAVLKPDIEEMLVNPDFAAQVNALHPNYISTGVIDPNTLNVGLSNFTTDISLVNLPINHLTLPEAIQLGTTEAYSTWLTSGVYEGGWLMKPIEQTIGGMHYMSLFHDGWTTNPTLGAPVINQLSIVPAVGINYCVLSPGVCTGVVTPTIKPKSSNNIGISIDK